MIDDIVSRWDYLGVYLDGDIKKNNIVLMTSIDGVQLYKDKDLDCWLYIWIVLNLSLDKWYRKTHVLPGGFLDLTNQRIWTCLWLLDYTISQHFRKKASRYGIHLRMKFFDLNPIFFSQWLMDQDLFIGTDRLDTVEKKIADYTVG